MIKAIGNFIKSFTTITLTEKMVKDYINNVYPTGKLLLDGEFNPRSLSFIVSLNKEFVNLRVYGVIESDDISKSNINGVRGFVEEYIYRSSSVFNVYTEEGICFRGVAKSDFKRTQKIPNVYQKEVTIYIPAKYITDYIKSL